MSTVQFYFLWFACGGTFGQIIADLIAVHLLPWYNTPGGGPAMCDCTKVVVATANSMVWAHVAGGVIGGLLFFSVALARRLHRGNTSQPT